MVMATCIAHWTDGKSTLKLFAQGKTYYTRYAHTPNQFAEPVFIEPNPKNKDKAIAAAALRSNGLRKIL